MNGFSEFLEPEPGGARTSERYLASKAGQLIHDDETRASGKLEHQLL